MIEERNRPLERELREKLVQELAGILPQIEVQPELQNACLQEAVKFPQRKQCFFPVQHFNPNAGQKFVWTKFCPQLEKAQEHINTLFINALRN
jgi:hypothetical protein